MQRDDLEAVFYGDGRVPVPWATDCPVRFDAWRVFTEPGPPRQGSHEQHREDLILAINEEHGIQRVMDHFWSLGMTECQPVASGSFVAARLTLDELVRAVVPMTNLCGVVRSAREIALTEGTQGVEDALEGRFRKQPRTSDIHDNLERRHERSRQLTWFLNVLARVIMDAPAPAYVAPPSAPPPGPPPPGPPPSGPPPPSAPPPVAPEPPPDAARTDPARTDPAGAGAAGTDPAEARTVAVLTGMLTSVSMEPALTRQQEEQIRGVIDRRQRYPIMSVTRNREASPAVVRSRSTIKADAAEQVFSVDCSSIGWAVVDSGIDARHPAFFDWDRPVSPTQKPVSRIVRAFNFVGVRGTLSADVLENGLVDWSRALRYVEMRLPASQPPPVRPHMRYTIPQDPHGTHIAGILGGWWPDRHFRGICSKIRLYDFRVLDDQGQGDEFSIVTALQAVRHINEQAGRIVIAGVNISLSVPHDVATSSTGWTPVCIECDHLARSGVVVVAAAGNSGFTGAARTLGADYRNISISDPGNAEAVITVGSTHRSNPHRHGVSYFSSRGPTGDGRPKPDLLAPGEDIDGPIPGEGISAMHGTSQAAAHVSGAAAMLLARNRELLGRPERIKQILCTTATDLARERDFQGHGLVDVLRAMQSV